MATQIKGLIFFLVRRPALLVILILASCTAKKTPIPQGWFIGGQPLASTHNEILAAGTTLYLPQKFMLEAATDSVVRLTQQPNGETLVHLLTGTAIVQLSDPQFSVSLLANGNTVRLTGNRLLLQNQVDNTRILLIDGQAVVNHGQQKWELSAKADNLFELKAGKRSTKKLSTREIDRVFPEITRARLLLAVR
ncbi:MAG: hypothetical protein ACOY5B_12630 [Spirochaetota bacterium]